MVTQTLMMQRRSLRNTPKIEERQGILRDDSVASNITVTGSMVELLGSIAETPLIRKKYGILRDDSVASHITLSNTMIQKLDKTYRFSAGRKSFRRSIPSLENETSGSFLSPQVPRPFHRKKRPVTRDSASDESSEEEDESSPMPKQAFTKKIRNRVDPSLFEAALRTSSSLSQPSHSHTASVEAASPDLISPEVKQHFRKTKRKTVRDKDAEAFEAIVSEVANKTHESPKAPSDKEDEDSPLPILGLKKKIRSRGNPSVFEDALRNSSQLSQPHSHTAFVEAASPELISPEVKQHFHKTKRKTVRDKDAEAFEAIVSEVANKTHESPKAPSYEEDEDSPLPILGLKKKIRSRGNPSVFEDALRNSSQLSQPSHSHTASVEAASPRLLSSETLSESERKASQISQSGSVDLDVDSPEVAQPFQKRRRKNNDPSVFAAALQDSSQLSDLQNISMSKEAHHQGSNSKSSSEAFRGFESVNESLNLSSQKTKSQQTLKKQDVQANILIASSSTIWSDGKRYTILKSKDFDYGSNNSQDNTDDPKRLVKSLPNAVSLNLPDKDTATEIVNKTRSEGSHLPSRSSAAEAAIPRSELSDVGVSRSKNLKASSEIQSPLQQSPAKNTPIIATPTKNVGSSSRMQMRTRKNTRNIVPTVQGTGSSSETQSPLQQSPAKNTPIIATPTKNVGSSSRMQIQTRKNTRNIVPTNQGTRSSETQSPLQQSPVRHTPIVATPTKNVGSSSQMQIQTRKNTRNVVPTVQGTGSSETQSPLQESPVRHTPIVATPTKNVGSSSQMQIQTRKNSRNIVPTIQGTGSSSETQSPLRRSPVKNTPKPATPTVAGKIMSPAAVSLKNASPETEQSSPVLSQGFRKRRPPPAEASSRTTALRNSTQRSEISKQSAHSQEAAALPPVPLTKERERSFTPSDERHLLALMNNIHGSILNQEYPKNPKSQRQKINYDMKEKSNTFAPRGTQERRIQMQEFVKLVKQKENEERRIQKAKEEEKRMLRAEIPKKVAKKVVVKKSNIKRPVNPIHAIAGKKSTRLKKPQYWATHRLYKLIISTCEKKFGEIQAYKKAEKFVVWLCKQVQTVIRRKKLENYRDIAESVKKALYRLGIIKSHHDYFLFIENYLPFLYRLKVTPCTRAYNRVSGIPIPPGIGLFDDLKL
ncbi:hypothetical protein C0J52_11607 [Blattella germanica]|nr:hypothetical protein C0J52_11607 [Blattella germanica]